MQYLRTIFIGNTRHLCKVKVDMTHILSHSAEEIISLVASPVFTEGVAAHVTHSYQPSKRVTRLSFEGTPPRVILWETEGHCRTIEISLESLDCHMIARHLIWIRRSLIMGGCIYALVSSKPVKNCLV